jgi:hypothetical protein
MAMWAAWTHGKLYISQQPDLPRRVISHVYGPHTRGNLQVATCKFFCSVNLVPKG